MTEQKLPRIECTESSIAKVLDYLRNRGGLRLWLSQDLSTPSRRWTLPYLDENGVERQPPHWSVKGCPRIVADHPRDIDVCIYEVVETVLGEHFESRKVLAAVARWQRSSSPSQEYWSALNDDHSGMEIRRFVKLVTLEQYLQEKGEPWDSTSLSTSS